MFVPNVIKAPTGTTVSFVSAEKSFLLCVISIFIQQGNISFRDDFFPKNKSVFRIFGGNMRGL